MLLFVCSCAYFCVRALPVCVRTCMYMCLYLLELCLFQCSSEASTTKQTPRLTGRARPTHPYPPLFLLLRISILRHYISLTTSLVIHQTRHIAMSNLPLKSNLKVPSNNFVLRYPKSQIYLLRRLSALH